MKDGGAEDYDLDPQLDVVRAWVNRFAKGITTDDEKNRLSEIIAILSESSLDDDTVTEMKEKLEYRKTGFQKKALQLYL